MAPPIGGLTSEDTEMSDPGTRGRCRTAAQRSQHCLRPPGADRAGVSTRSGMNGVALVARRSNTGFRHFFVHEHRLLLNRSGVGTGSESVNDRRQHRAVMTAQMLQSIHTRPEPAGRWSAS